MKIYMIIMIEAAMLVGTVSAALVLPGNTPLLSFLVVSSIALVAGNYVFVVRRVRLNKAVASTPPKEHSTQFLRDLGTCAICWLIYWLLVKL